MPPEDLPKIMSLRSRGEDCARREASSSDDDDDGGGGYGDVAFRCIVETVLECGECGELNGRY